MRVLHSSKTCSEFSKFMGFQAKAPFPNSGGAQKNTQTVC